MSAEKPGDDIEIPEDFQTCQIVLRLTGQITGVAPEVGVRLTAVTSLSCTISGFEITLRRPVDPRFRPIFDKEPDCRKALLNFLNLAQSRYGAEITFE